MTRAFVLFALLVGCGVAVGKDAGERPAPLLHWKELRPKGIGGAPVEIVGAPRAATVAGRMGLLFDGFDDGCVVQTNPLAGLAEFTIEVLFFPQRGGTAEQRFFHAQDREQRRFLFELRTDESGDSWCLDTFLLSEKGRLTLIDRSKWHPMDRWYWAAVTYRDGTMTHFVEGERETGGSVDFAPMTEGATSLGMRMNRVSWFRGAVAEVRVFDRALQPAALSRIR